MSNKEGQECNLNYEPVLVCPAIASNIQGIKSVGNFGEFTKNDLRNTITFKKDGRSVTITTHNEVVKEVVNTPVNYKKTVTFTRSSARGKYSRQRDWRII